MLVLFALEYEKSQELQLYVLDQMKHLARYDLSDSGER